MTEETAQDHPSKARGATGLPALVFGLVGAPSAWIVAQLVSFEVAQRACFPKTIPLEIAAFGGAHVVQASAVFLALLISASAIAVATLAWRHTRSEHEGGGETLLAVGEGRSRFMAFAGILTSVGFLIAILFSAPALFVVPAC